MTRGWWRASIACSPSTEGGSASDESEVRVPPVAVGDRGRWIGLHGGALEEFALPGRGAGGRRAAGALGAGGGLRRAGERGAPAVVQGQRRDRPLPGRGGPGRPAR